MKTLKKILIVVLAVIILGVIVSFFLPSSVRVERTAVMNAPVETVFEQINTVKNWEKWSPWFKYDTLMKLTYSGPESGAGAKYSWESEKMGNGSLTITSSVPNQSIASELDFMENGKATAGYTFEKTEGGTKMVWSMDCEMGMNPIAKYMGLMMDKMLGNDFENGMNNIKTIVESMPPAPAPVAEVTAPDSIAAPAKVE